MLLAKNFPCLREAFYCFLMLTRRHRRPAFFGRSVLFDTCQAVDGSQLCSRCGRMLSTITGSIRRWMIGRHKEQSWSVLPCFGRYQEPRRL
jgi:hypothetical protein